MDMNMFCILFGLFGIFGGPEVSVVVADGDTGEPVGDAIVEIAFPGRKTMDGIIYGGFRTRKTSAKGLCKATGPTEFNHVDINVEKDGYYKSSLTAHFPVDENLRILPGASVVTVALMRVIHPIPLYVSKEPAWRPDEIFGKGTNTLEFDMMAGDYLPPVGKGKVADVVFTREPCQVLASVTKPHWGVIYSTRDQVRVHFPNPGDGIVSMPTNACSLLKIRTAPENGYKPDYLSYKIVTTNDAFASWEADPNLCFRIRTKFDANGNVVEANYGKIYGGLGFSQSFSHDKIREPRAERMRFLYYLNKNPTDRNLEYDRRHNLKEKNGPKQVRP
jgi:hypothetical protein